MDLYEKLIMGTAILCWSLLCFFIIGCVLWGLGWCAWRGLFPAIEFIYNWIRKVGRFWRNPLRHRIRELNKLHRQVKAELKRNPLAPGLYELEMKISKKLERITQEGERISLDKAVVDSFTDRLEVISTATEAELQLPDPTRSR